MLWCSHGDGKIVQESTAMEQNCAGVRDSRGNVAVFYFYDISAATEICSQTVEGCLLQFY